MQVDPGDADQARPDPEGSAPGGPEGAPPPETTASAREPQPAIPLTTPIREANGLLTYMGSDGRRYVVFGEPPPEGEARKAKG